jgi:transcriptional regulator with XRE-family HTH domain
MIGQTLKDLRLNYGYKQDWVASEIGLTQGYLSRIENERITPPLNVLEQFAKFYGKSSPEVAIINLFK